jgi:hypothetical protein
MAAKGISIEGLLNEHKMSRKQYYLRISKFIGAGMIKRKDGKYILTLFGKVIHEVQLLLLELIKSHWQPEAVDSLDSMKENTGRECKHLFEDRLIENAALVPITSTIVSSGVVIENRKEDSRSNKCSFAKVNLNNVNGRGED